MFHLTSSATFPAGGILLTLLTAITLKYLNWEVTMSHQQRMLAEVSICSLNRDVYVNLRLWGMEAYLSRFLSSSACVCKLITRYT